MLKISVNFPDGDNDVFIAQSFFVDRYAWSFQVSPDKRVTFIRNDIKTVTVSYE